MNTCMRMTVPVELTPAQVAEAFWNLDSAQMADFFAALDGIADVKLCFQMVHVVHEIADRSEAGDYAAMNGFRTMLAHAQEYADASTSHRVGVARAAIARFGSAP